MKIDLVYLWVNDKDEKWLKKKEKYCESTQKYDDSAINECRFANNDELKYSLRSVERYASWINKIYIVTDNQVPEWLNLNHPKVRIVYHSEIIPEENLPVFNANAIEARLPFIPDLEEYFLFANDDMYIWNHVDENFFFEDDKPIYRMEKKFSKFKKCKTLYAQLIENMYNLVSSKYPINMELSYPHHNIDPYRKSVFIECVEEFQDIFDETLNHRFRDYTDMQRMIVTFYSVAKDKAIWKKVRADIWTNMFDNIYRESYARSLSVKHLKKILNINTSLLCLNDVQVSNAIARNELKYVLENKFNLKSSFEK